MSLVDFFSAMSSSMKRLYRNQSTAEFCQELPGLTTTKAASCCFSQKLENRGK
jgi:hypothetical protein